MSAISETEAARLSTLLGPDTPPRGVKIDLEEGLAVMSHLGAFPGLVEFIRDNPLYQDLERQAYFNKATRIASQDEITYKVGIFEGSGQPVKGLSLWNLILRPGHTYQDFRVGFFSTPAWTEALESAEFHSQLEEPNPRIKSGDSLWQQIKNFRHMRAKYWASDLYAEPRPGDILPAVGIDLNRATSGLIVQGNLEVHDFQEGPEAQAIKPIVLTIKENLQKALSVS